LIRSPIWLVVLSSHNAFGCETDGCCVDVALCQCCCDANPHTTIPFAHRGFVRVVAALPFAVGATVQSIPGEFRIRASPVVGAAFPPTLTPPQQYLHS
jgi:hypothetical protein